jgi:hypothetical protein
MRSLWTVPRQSRTGTSFAKFFAAQWLSPILVALALSGVATAQNPVTDWDAIAVTTVTSGNPVLSPGSNFGGGAGIYLAYTRT